MKCVVRFATMSTASPGRGNEVGRPEQILVGGRVGFCRRIFPYSQKRRSSVLLTELAGPCGDSPNLDHGFSAATPRNCPAR